MSKRHRISKSDNQRLQKLKFRKRWLVWSLIFFLILSSIIPLRLAITRLQVPTPKAILVLDGNINRVKFAVKFWQSHSDLDIWLSGCTSNLGQKPIIFRQMGIPMENIHFDIRAIDTVTHFTTLVEDFTEQKLWHVYLLTSDYHMNRAIIIATLIFGSRGIAVTPIAIPSKKKHPESLIKVARDAIRSLLWILFESTGSELFPQLLQKKLMSCSRNWPLPLAY